MNVISSRRVAALLEVLGVTAAGPLLMWTIRQLFGIRIVNPLNELSAGMSGHELLIASGQMLELLLFQYCGYFLLIFPLNWWYRRTALASYGLLRPSVSWRVLALSVVATGALATAPALTVAAVNSLNPGETVAWRQALMEMPPRWQTWLFTAVMSWAVIPVLEELFHRGYCLRRLAEDWGRGPAIVGSACLFTFAHSQYFLLNAYNLATIVTLLFFSICVGTAFVMTRSLVPGIAAHMILNLPLSSPWQAILPALLLLIAISTWRYGMASLYGALRSTNTRLAAVLVVVSISYEVIMARDAIWPSVAATALLVVAVIMEIRERRSSSAVPPQGR